MALNNDIYNGQFNGNILVIGRSGCGKTTFLEKLALNNFFGDLVKTEWVSGIEIDKKREAEIQSCFKNQTAIYTALDKSELDILIDKFKLIAEQENDNVNLSNSFVLIVLDDVSGVADVSKNFGNFLTVSGKFGYNCVYVFHNINQTSQNWQKIISQTNIFNIFPASVPLNSVSKILQSNCIINSRSYIPTCQLWIFRLFTELANNNKRDCFTIDSTFENKNDPGRYRTNAENPEKQVRYFGKIKDDKLYNVFISWCIKSEELKNKVYFKIEKLKTKVSAELFNVDKTLQNGAGRGRFDEADGPIAKRFRDSVANFSTRERKSARPRFPYDR